MFVIIITLLIVVAPTPRLLTGALAQRIFNGENFGCRDMRIQRIALPFAGEVS